MATKKEMVEHLNKILKLNSGFKWNMSPDKIRRIYFAVLERCGNGNQQ